MTEGPEQWMPRERWDALVRGEGCPLCASLVADVAADAYSYTVADLRVSAESGRLTLESPALGRIYLTRPPLLSWGDEVESVFTPFTGARLEHVVDELEDVATTRQIQLCCVQLPALERAWLELTFSDAELSIYRSRFGGVS